MSADVEAGDHCFAQHVDEADELRQIVAQLVASRGEEAAGYRRFSQIVTKYQEQSQLLDPLLEDLVKPVAGLLFVFATQPEAARPAAITDASRFLWLLSTVRGYKVVLRFFPNDVDKFEPVVGLLFHLNAVESARGLEDPSVWEAQYVLLLWLSVLVLIPFHLSLVDSSLGAAATAAAGSKPIPPEDPATPKPSQPVSAAAAAAPGDQQQQQQAQQQQQQQQHGQGQGQVHEGGSPASPYPPIVGTILSLCRGYLGGAGSTREMAAVVVGRLVTRPDMRGALEEWVGWSCEVLEQQGEDGSSLRRGFLVLGCALSLATIFKLGKRDALLGPAARIFPAAAALLGSPTAASNALARKLAVKLIQRIGLVFLRPRLAAWRYSKGRSALLGQQKGAASTSSSSSVALEAGAAGRAGVLGAGEGAAGYVEAEAEEDVEHAEQLEGVIEALLTGLAARDTVVRWSAAKGLGRVTGRLPKELADDVVGSVLESFFTAGASDTAWHGGCLAVAELARRGLLLPERLPEVAPLVARALEYDVRRGPCSVGAHVRDAAAYVCWAFARAYTSDALGAAASLLAAPLISLACYDREVNCRRAAAAAYQECVGRLGSFPHGLEILTAADYFTVSTRSTAYLTVAPYVASFPEYFEPLATHLLLVKLRHWEKALRELAATAVAVLVRHRPSFFLETALPLLLPLVTDNVLETRHGAVAGIAELLPALRDQGVPLGAELEAAVAEIIPTMDRSKVTKGKGGEIMRCKICRLIETTSLVGLPLSSDQRACLHTHLCDNLRHPSPDVQQAAAAALGAFARHYLAPEAAPQIIEPAQSGRVQPGEGGVPLHAALQLTAALFLRELREGSANPLARRGAALALGALPRSLLEPLADEVLAVLAAATEIEPSPDYRDAEARANAVRALGRVALVLHCPEVACCGRNGGVGPAGAAGLVAASAGAAAGAAGGEAKQAKEGGSNLEALQQQEAQQHQKGAEGSSAVAELSLSAAAAQRVCSAAVEPLLHALEDYSTDNRGDVGSWVREACMEQLARLLPPMLPRTAGAAAEAGAAGEGRGEPLPAAAMQQPQQCQQPQQMQDKDEAWELSVGSIASKVLLALVRQSLERISRVREAAARALQALLPRAAAAGVPGAADMAAVLCPLPLDGFVTSEALPAAAALLAHPPMQLAVLEGLSFSIGGLDNQLSAAAGDALAGAVQCVAEGAPEGAGCSGSAEGQEGEEGEESRLLHLGASFVRLWEEAQQSSAGTTPAGVMSRRARLATPLLAAADVLLSRTPLLDALAAHTTTVAAKLPPASGGAEGGPAAGTDVAAWGLGGRLLACVRGEVRGCTDIPRLHLASGVLCRVADLPQPVKGGALASAIGLLANRYPKVRRYAAEQLYTWLLTFDPEEWGEGPSGGPASDAPDTDTALELLSESAWDGPLEGARQARSRLYPCFGLPEPQLVKRAGVAPGADGKGAAGLAQGQGDENASYQALIDHAMRGM